MRQREQWLVRTLVGFATNAVNGSADALWRLGTEATAGLFPDADVATLVADAAGQLRVTHATTERAALLEEHELRVGEGPAVETFRQGASPHVIALGEVASEDWPAFAPMARALGFVASLSLPMRFQGQRLGVQTVVFRAQPTGADLDLIELASGLSDGLAAAVRQLDVTTQHDRVAAQLQHALRTRVVIEQAKGRVAEGLGVTPDDAFERLRTFARRHGRPLHALCADVSDGRLAATSLATVGHPRSHGRPGR